MSGREGEPCPSCGFISRPCHCEAVSAAVRQCAHPMGCEMPAAAGDIYCPACRSGVDTWSGIADACDPGYNAERRAELLDIASPEDMAADLDDAYTARDAALDHAAELGAEDFEPGATCDPEARGFYGRAATAYRDAWADAQNADSRERADNGDPSAVASWEGGENE